MLFTRHREILEEFINLYKDSPCLWQVNRKDYHNRAKREEAYRRLVEKLQELEPSANKDFVIKKINNFRSNLRKEVKKVEKSKKNGDEDIYEPKLWYYHHFEFLFDQTSTRNNLGSDDELDIDEESNKKADHKDSEDEESNESNDPDLTKCENNKSMIAPQTRIKRESCGMPSTSKKSRIETAGEKIHSNETQTVPKEIMRQDEFSTRYESRIHESEEKDRADNSLNQPQNIPLIMRDEFTTYGEYVANEIRKLRPIAQVYAKHYISNVLFKAAIGEYDGLHSSISNVSYNAPAANFNVETPAAEILPNK